MVARWAAVAGHAASARMAADTYDASIEMAELSLLPAVRRASRVTFIVADGTSCRHQIKDGAHRNAVHAAVVLSVSIDRNEAQLNFSS